MIRVLMLSKACIVGTYQRKLEEIARRDIELLTLVPPSWRDERGETVLERVYTRGYRLETIPIRFNGSFHLHYYHGLKERVCNFMPDIVHIDEEPYNVATWHALHSARLAGAKALFFSWQNIHRHYPPPFSVGEQWVLRHAEHAIAGTEGAARVLREKGYEGPLSVIPQFGVDPQLFTPAPPGRRNSGAFTIGYVGRLVEEKGLALLLRAAAELGAVDWQMRLVGGGPLRGELEALARALGIDGRVRFDRQVASTVMPALYREMDVLVLPSLTRPNWKEQFGRVLIEAMASGVPVIGSDSGAIPDVVGSAGLIFPEGAVAALAARLRQLRGDPALRERLSRAGRQRVLAHFTHAQVAAATVAVYREMTGQ